MYIVSPEIVDAFALDYEDDNGDLETFGIYLTKEEAEKVNELHNSYPYYEENFQIREVKAQKVTQLIEVY